ncbi:FAD dependent oxidoreductase [Dichotomocladium elegans]|nr:FAD dependent oxidoreductase [Dichotomocladium elegans]
MYVPPVPGSKIIIVGGGAFGLSTAYALSSKADKHYDIWVFDRQSIPAPDAASTDINKIVRMDYADEPLYMHLMIETYSIWREWNEERAAEGESPVYHETGVLMMGENGSFTEFELKSMQCIREAGYGHAIEELPTPASIADRFPIFKDAVANGFNVAYLNKLGGWCNSTEAIKHCYRKCVANGVHFVLGEKAGTMTEFVYKDKDQEVAGIRTKDGETHLCDLVVLATGAWTPGLVDMQDKLIATAQTVVQFQLPAPLLERYGTEPGVWSGNLSSTGYYGFAPNSDGIIKIGHHSRGYLNLRDSDKISVPRTQVSNPKDTIPIMALRQFRAFLNRFFPFSSTLDIVYARTCWYCDSADGHFLVTPHPQLKNLIIASGDSGHGMK